MGLGFGKARHHVEIVAERKVSLSLSPSAWHVLMMMFQYMKFLVSKDTQLGFIHTYTGKIPQ